MLLLPSFHVFAQNTSIPLRNLFELGCMAPVARVPRYSVGLDAIYLSMPLLAVFEEKFADYK
jgi:hypothetical protein